MIIGILGLGLIGGSFAKSIKAKSISAKIFAFDLDEGTITNAKNCGAIDEVLTPENISKCDLLLLATSPKAAVNLLKDNAGKISQNTIVVDLCGVKRAVCEKVSAIAKKYGFIYVGGHPMAGREKSGFEASTENLYDGASMILTPENNNNPQILETLKKFFLDIGFANVIFSTPQQHDKIIAYTSQLPHIISSAYIKSPEALKRKGFAGFTAGSFKDMSRVASVDEKLWTELFTLNRDFLIEQTEIFIENLKAYLEALKNNDAAEIERLLREGREMKLLAWGE